MKFSRIKTKSRINLVELRNRPDATALRNKISSLPFIEKLIMRQKIADECMVTKMTISNWCNGLSRIDIIYKNKIEEIFGEKIFEAQTNN